MNLFSSITHRNDWEMLLEQLKKLREEQECTIIIYGCGSCGKTSIVKNKEFTNSSSYINTYRKIMKEKKVNHAFAPKGMTNLEKQLDREKALDALFSRMISANTKEKFRYLYYSFKGFRDTLKEISLDDSTLAKLAILESKIEKGLDYYKLLVLPLIFFIERFAVLISVLTLIGKKKTENFLKSLTSSMRSVPAFLG